jgi:DNA-binding NarL/FixJ family response regulator
MPRILLYSREPMLARGFESVLQQVQGFEMLSPCNSLAVVLARGAADSPDVVLIDLTPEITFATLSEIKEVMAGSKVVLWVNFIATDLAFQAIGLGVRGILRKTLPADLQVKCLQKVYAGELWFEKALTDAFLCSHPVNLTRRESLLVNLLAQGLKNKEIAAALMVSEGTVKVYLSRLFHKVGVKDRFELALFGLKNLGNAQSPNGTMSVERDEPSALPAPPLPVAT